MALVVDLDTGDSLVIGGRITVTMLEKSGRRAKIVVDAPKDVRVAHNRAAPDVALTVPARPRAGR